MKVFLLYHEIEGGGSEGWGGKDGEKWGDVSFYQELSPTITKQPYKVHIVSLKRSLWLPEGSASSNYHSGKGRSRFERDIYTIVENTYSSLLGMISQMVKPMPS